MTKRMLIDATQPEETRVVVLDGNRLEDVEFETTHRKQIKGNIYLGKIMRVEPSLQACFVDYGGNKHGFMAFGEIHPDYYNVSEDELTEIDAEVNEIIESKKQAIKEREAERERIRQEKAAARAAREAERERLKELEAAEETIKDETTKTESDVIGNEIIETMPCAESTEKTTDLTPETVADNISQEEATTKKAPQKKRLLKKRIRKQEEAKKEAEQIVSEQLDGSQNEETLKVLAEDIGCEETHIQAEVTEDEGEEVSVSEEKSDNSSLVEDDIDIDDDDDDENMDFELQRKLMKARKLFHRHKIQDVIKEGQTVLVQVVKEERGNKGAALTTYLSLAGRYCVLMPNRIKSGGVSRKITNAADRNRLKGIVKDLPLTTDMSIIVRTAGEEKTKTDIVRDYNYLIRTWNKIRLDALNEKAPVMIHEEGNLIKRALRDIYSKDTSEIIVAGEEAYNSARDFFKILSPHNLKKIKSYKNNDMPLFQRFQVEGQLDKLHDTTAQLESGGYLVINPTEALVSIDVNSGRATKEKGLEETALKTNLEACDEIARQLRMRNLAGLVVIDFIDMDEPANNHAVEKRMKEALKKDRSRIQIGKMSMFGLLELSRQRIHSAFWENSYQTCPHCQGKGIIRTTESSAVFILRAIEEEGIKNRTSKLNVYIPSEIAIYILNQKRKNLIDLEQKYKMDIVICADDTIKCVSGYRMERIKISKEEKAIVMPLTEVNDLTETTEEESRDENNGSATENKEDKTYYERKRGRGDRRYGRNRFDRRKEKKDYDDNTQPMKDKQEAVILYDSHDTSASSEEDAKPVKEKSTWWKKLIKG